MLSILLYLGLSYVLMSFIEYVVHRFVMHRRTPLRLVYDAFEAHTILHHATYFRRDSFDRCGDRASRYVSIDLGAAFMVAATSPVWGLMWLVFGPLATGVFVSFAFLHGLLWGIVHREMHAPTGRWWFRNALYRFWRDYHRGHHAHVGTNYNVLCVGADWLLGTLAKLEEA